MSLLRGYVYDSYGPDIPILAVIFDGDDRVMALKVVAGSNEGLQFIAKELAPATFADMEYARRGTEVSATSTTIVLRA